MLLLHSLSFPFVSSKITTETDKPLFSLCVRSEIKQNFDDFQQADYAG